jgi:hypothetical protein
MQPLLALAVAVGIAVGLAACSGPYFGTFTPADETGPWGYKGTSRKETLVARDDFSIELVRFTDARRPRSLERGPTEQIMDVYDPDDLLAGVNTRLPALYEKYLTYKPRSAKNYKVEIELRELRTEVLNGDFWHGPFGRYKVKMEMEATARRPDSQVVLRRGYRFEDVQKRKTYTGRSPSVEMDEARLIDLVDAAVRTTAKNFAYDIRQTDAKHWRPDHETAPIPTTRVRMVPQPTLTRATGSTTMGESELVVPAPVKLPAEPPQYAPDSIPEMTPLGATGPVRRPLAIKPAASRPITW